MFDLIVHLRDAGWTTPMDSDGTTYNAAGTQVKHAGSGSFGLANAGAWVRLEPPVSAGSLPNVSLQHSLTASDNINWRLKYNAANQMTGGFGAPTAVSTPSTAGDFIVLGGGTDAVPTMDTLFPADNTYLLHVITQDETPYTTNDFCLFTYENGSDGSTYSYWTKDGTNAANAVVASDDPYTQAQLDPALIAVGAGASGIPVVTMTSPDVWAAIYRNDPLEFTVISPLLVAFASISIIIKFPAPASLWEAVAIDGSFSGLYSAYSARSATTGGYTYTVRRQGGWPQRPELSVVAIDVAGNVNA